MPTVPTYGQRRVKRAALPGARQTSSAETFESAGGTVAQAEAGLARAEGQAAGAAAAFGATAASIATAGVAEQTRLTREHTDQVALLAAERQLGELEVSLLHAQDRGALQVRGKDVLPLRTQVLGAFDEQAGMIASNLGNDRQRLAFEQVRQRRRLGIFETVERHTATQLAAYEKTEAEAGLANAVNLAVTNWNNPARIRDELGTLARIVDQHGAAMNMGPEARAELLGRLRTEVHEGVITRMLVNQQEPAARVYFEELHDQIDGRAIARIEETLRLAGVDRQAQVAAETIWAAHAPADDDDPISLDVMETAARERFRDAPDVLKATIAELRSRKAGVDDGRRARMDARDDAVWTAAMNGATLDQLRQMPAFVHMDGRAQTQVRDYFNAEAVRRENLAYTRSQRALAQDALRERTLERDGWSAYWDLSDPARLRTLSRADILRQLPTLGRDHVNRLLTDQESLTRSDAAVRSATIDTELFRDVAFNAGLDYVYNTPSALTEEQRANLGKLRATVEGEIARRQQGANRPLTFEEKRTLMQSLIEEKVLLRDAGWFWFDRPAPAAIVTGDNRARAFVPLADIPAAAQTEALDYLRGINPRLSDEQLRARYRDRLERAYAVTLMRGTRAEVEAILKGEQ